MTTRCEVRVLGQIAVTFADGRAPVIKFRTRKAALLLAYLALHLHKAHAREFLIELLWPETDAAVGRNNLSTTLSILRRQLEPDGGKDLLLANHTTVQLNPLGITVDAHRFEALALRGLHTRLDLAERQAALHEAMALWAPPLAGIYDDWALDEQARLEALADQAREVLESLPVAQTPLPTASISANDALPVAFSRFLGREQEVERLGTRLQTARLVTLLGPGGVGKTRLSLEVARASVAAFERVVFVSLAELPLPSLIVPTLRRALIEAAPAPDPLAQIVAVINTIPGRVLVLLDNLEHLLPTDSEGDDDEEKTRFGPARLVRQLLESCPQLTVLATSRQPLGVEGEQQFSVEPLAGAVGVELFVDRARTVRPDFVLNAGNKGEIEAICTLLDGLPLAIELAAAWVRVLSLRELHERLEKEVLWLEGRRRDLNPRQRSLEATLRWSWQLLSVEQKCLLGALSVFRGGSTLEAIEALGSAPHPLGLLYSLVDRSLVLVEPSPQATRYRLLEAIRQFARDRLEESREAEVVRDRHLTYYVALAEQAEPQLTGPEQVLWLDRLESEYDNLCAALSGSRESPPSAAQGLRLAGALWRFWLMHGHFTEGREQLALALVSSADGASISRAKALHGAGVLANHQSDYTVARAHHEESLAIRRTLGDQAGIAQSLNTLGNIAQDRSNYVTAGVLYQESLAIRRKLDDPLGIAACLNNLGFVASNQGDYATARKLYEESLEIQRTLGNRQGIAHSLGHLGVMTYYQGNYAAARAFYQESLAIRRELGNRLGIAACLNNLGNIAQDQGDPVAARALYVESLAIKREIGDRLGIAASLTSLGLIAMNLGDYAAARVQYEESLAIYQEIGNPMRIAVSLEGFAVLAALVGTPLRASRLWGAAEHLREENGVPLLPKEHLAQGEQLTAARRSHGVDAAFDAAWSEGRAMTLEQAIVLARAIHA